MTYTVDKLAHLTQPRRRALIILALDEALYDLIAPAPTIEVVAMVAKRLGSSETRLIARVLCSVAPHIPQAKQSPIVFKQYGREMRRWIWSPKEGAKL